jgi:hypothetical protein
MKTSISRSGQAPFENGIGPVRGIHRSLRAAAEARGDWASGIDCLGIPRRRPLT